MPASTTHDVKLNNVGYLVKPGSYRKRSAPLMGARFTTGDPDYSQLGPLQHWVQSCWIGGMGQENWVDDAMYHEAVGVDSSVHERLALTRDLTQPAAKGYGLEGADLEREFVTHTYNDVTYLFCFGYNGSGTDGKLYRYTQSSDSWAISKTFTSSLVRTAASYRGALLVGSTASHIHKLTGSPSSWTTGTIAFPSGLGGGNNTPYAMKAFKGLLYVAFGNGEIWRIKSDLTFESTRFYDLPDGGWIIDMEIHLGFLYLLSNRGIIYRTDANNTGEIWRGDPGTVGVCQRSYDGRLFVMLRETDDAGSRSEAAVYQLSGSAMTELKRWGKTGKTVVPSHRMLVMGGRLFYGASGLLGMEDGFGVAVYDAAEDAHSIFATNRDTTTYTDTSGGGVGWTVDDLVIFGGRLFITTRDNGLFRTPFTFADYQAGRENATYDVTLASFGGGWLKSSNYDGGTPGLLKLWTSIELDYELPAAGTTIKVDYSLDNGRTWTTDAVSLSYASAGRKRTRVYLSSVRASSFKWRLKLSSSSTSATPVVYSVNVSYLPLQDPQWQWEFTVVISELQELLDGTTATVAPATVLAALEDLYRANTPTTFVDVDGTTLTNGVLITDFVENVFITDAPLEAEVRLTLLELIES